MSRYEGESILGQRGCSVTAFLPKYILSGSSRDEADTGSHIWVQIQRFL